MFETSRGRLIAALTRRFGVERIDDAEAAVQEAGLRALERWPGGTDRELEGWLVRVAYRALIDGLRRDGRGPEEAATGPEATELEVARVDDELCLAFLCCHPALPRAAQTALTLRVAFGLSTPHIARLFLSDERAIAQRLVRAKQALRDAGATFALPDADELPARLEGILAVLHALFTHGHALGADGDVVARESLRLVRLCTDDARWETPEGDALRALFAFHLARSPGRFAADGSLLLLHEQDRSRWDGALVTEGFLFLGRSARGAVSAWHLEAGIAACHARAASHDATDWEQIVELYDGLRRLAPSPVVDVSRAFAVAMVRGAAAGLDELDAIPERELVQRYPYALATYAELLAAQGHLAEARESLDRALAVQTSAPEHALLLRKRAALGGGAPGSRPPGR